MNANYFVITILLAIFCFIIERVRPGWKLVSVRTWPTRVIAINVIQLAVILGIGKIWEDQVQGVSLFDLRTTSPLFDGAIAYFIASSFIGGTVHVMKAIFFGASFIKSTTARSDSR